jgi:hypothetical protein
MTEGTEWVTLRVASQRLGRSPETIRRQIREGTFEYPAEREQRAPGDTRDRYKVRLPKAPDTPQATPHEALPPYPDLRDTVAALKEQISAQEQRHASERTTDASERHTWVERAIRAEQRADDLQQQLTRQQRVWWLKLREMLLGC